MTLRVGTLELGIAPAGPLTSPLDLLPLARGDDPEAVGIARLLISLDADGHPADGITLDPVVADLVEDALAERGLLTLDVTDDALLDDILHQVSVEAKAYFGLRLRPVDAGEARRALVEDLLAAGAWRTNLSEAPNLAVYKARVDLIAWSSACCPEDDPHALGDADLYGVAGPQGSIDYTARGLPERGETPFYCEWAARAVFAPDGKVKWLAPEQLTSGTLDVFRDMPEATPGGGFAIAWQGDPFGLQPGKGEGPGEGFSGAAISKGTDIWYTFLPWSDFGKAAGETDAWGRPLPAVPFAPPVRVTDNAACPYDDEGRSHDDHHASFEASSSSGSGGGPDAPTCPYCSDLCVDRDDSGFCIDADGRALAGRTGAARVNLRMVDKTLPDGTKTAQTVLAYEEKKAIAYIDPTQEGKHVVFHHFPRFDQPQAIGAGHLLDLPNRDGVEENARRVRLLVQSKGEAGETGPVMAAIYRQGLEDHGAPADIFLRLAYGGYTFDHFVEGDVNVSSMTPVEPGWCGASWTWDPDNLADASADNPQEDARARRGFLRGDAAILGYIWTSNHYAARGGADAYRFYVRRSFDGGKSCTDALGCPERPVEVGSVPDCGWTVHEPRLVPGPGSIQGLDGTPSAEPEDQQDPNAWHVAWGTLVNDPYDPAGLGTPGDLFLVRTTTSGEIYQTWGHDGYQGATEQPYPSQPGPRRPAARRSGAPRTATPCTPPGSRPSLARAST